MRKFSAVAPTETRNDVPVSRWQSEQWQMLTSDGSISASNAILPQ